MLAIAGADRAGPTRAGSRTKVRSVVQSDRPQPHDHASFAQRSPAVPAASLPRAPQRDALGWAHPSAATPRSQCNSYCEHRQWAETQPKAFPTYAGNSSRDRSDPRRAAVPHRELPQHGYETPPYAAIERLWSAWSRSAEARLASLDSATRRFRALELQCQRWAR